jgi:hypothetical protein
MAEFLREEWNIYWLDWSCNIILSVNPLASISTSGGRVLREALLNDLNIFGEGQWGAEIEIWDQFFTFRPCASISDSADNCGVRSDTFFEVSDWSILRYLCWVAELCWEHLFGSILVSGVISGSSFSPLASIVAFSSNISSDASLDGINIGSEFKWSTEIIVWDQFFTVRPVASSSISACTGSSLINTVAPNSLGCIFSDNDWMAEVLREQWSW